MTIFDFHNKVVSGLVVIPIYTFNEQLNLKQTKMLSLLLGFNHLYHIPAFYGRRSRSGVLETAFRNYGSDVILAAILDARKKFESIIRLIPGSYQNSDWKQLDGFFGLYYNEKTMEFM